ncbi:uncharacterized protein B0H64DRAFT_106109 [Chaetomium fimeti]|uniref:Uncharacterized protein n=1 Tax=Chaetomium fimeti TaxID=1854472 RepID=A0AAE0LTE7_9PEZI|nr:hypothetical protein B0H64DRAFT_106109 [Chaetomium fimeti]
MPIILAVVFLGLSPLRVAADWWDDFANNLGTDLAPVIALFGEAPTKQYLSESLTYIDYFIFAMAPLGILTAVVSAIRVRGGSSLRAFIGRSQEGMGAIEAELCSSTSRDVCELYNNGGISRIIGRPRMLELVYDPTASDYEFYDNTTAGLYSVQEYFVKDAKNNKKRKWAEMVPAGRLGGFLQDRPADQGNGFDVFVSSIVEGNASKPFAPSPNLTLNVWMKKVPAAAKYAAAATGLAAQGGVIVLGAVITYYLGLSREDSEISRYGFPLMACGTLMLCAGVFLCASLVGESTSKRRFQQVSDGIGPGPQRRPEFAWLQPGGQRVGDQEFDAFAYTDHLKEYMTSWKATGNVVDAFAPPADKTERSSTQLVGGPTVYGAVTMCVLGFIFQFIGLRDIHPSVSIAQLAATLLMSFVRSLLRTRRLDPSRNLLEGVSDFVRGYELDWLALRLASRDTAPGGVATANKSTETGVAYRPLWVLTGSDESPGALSHHHRACHASDNHHCIHRTRDSSIFLLRHDSDRDRAKRIIQASLAGDGEERVPVFGAIRDLRIPSETKLSPEKLSFAKKAFALRKQLVKFTGQETCLAVPDLRVPAAMRSWTAGEVAVRGLAVQLASAIGRVADALFSGDTIFKGRWRHSDSFYWSVYALGTIRRQYEPFPIYFSIHRNSQGGRWTTDPAVLEVALGLWCWSLRADARTDFRDESTGQRISGADEVTNYRIISIKADNSGSRWGLGKLNGGQLWLRNQRGLAPTDIFYSPGQAPKDSFHGSQDLFIESRMYRPHHSVHSGLPSESGNGPNVLPSTKRLFGWYAVPPGPLRAEDHIVSDCDFEAQRVDAPIPIMCAQDFFGLFLRSLFSIVDRLGGTFRVNLSSTASPFLDNTLVSEVVAILEDCHLGSQTDLLLTVLPAIGTRGLSTYEGLLRATRRVAKNLRLTRQWERGATLLDEAARCILVRHFGSTLVPPSRSSEVLNVTARLILQHIHHVFLGQQGNPKPNLPELNLYERLEHANLGHWWRGDGRDFGTLEGLRDEYIQALGVNEPSESSALFPTPRAAVILRSLAIGIPPSLHQILRGQGPTDDDLMDEFFSLIVERALELGTNVNAQDEAGKTALAIAADNGMTKVVAALLEGGSDTELGDNEEMTPLHHAARSGNLEVVQSLLWAKGDYESSADKHGMTPLLHAARNSHGSITEFIIAYAGRDSLMDIEFDLLAKAEWGEDEQVAVLKHLGKPWPTESCEAGRHPFVTFLEKKKFQVALEFINSNIIGFKYTGPIPPDIDRDFLSLAAGSGKRQVVERLLEKHAIPVTEFASSMIVAAMSGHADILQLLIEDDRVTKNTVAKGIKKIRKEAELLLAMQIVTTNASANDKGMTPLLFATKYGQEAMVYFLTRGVYDYLGRGEAVNRNILALAAGCVGSVIGQLQKANEPPSSDDAADTMVQEAKARAENILQRLLGHIWNPEVDRMLNWQDEDQRTVLMIAVENDLELGVKSLLARGGNPSLTNKEGKTAKQIAGERGNQKIIALFES